MKEDVNIDDLLNSYIDGELPARQQTELQRLVSHDKQIEERLSRLKKCRLLVNSIPRAEAPAGLVEDIKAAVERKALLEEPLAGYDRRKGARELLGRRLLAAAAMLGLVALLAAVIYTIVAPETVTTVPVARQPTVPHIVATAEQPVDEQGKDRLRFLGRLELVTKTPAVVSAYLNKTLESSSLLNEVYQGAAASCSVVCSKEQVNQLLADLNGIWNRLDSAKLFVETGQKGSYVVVEAVSASQVGEIITQKSLDDSIRVAKDFAVLNTLARQMPAGQLLAAAGAKDRSGNELTGIPKPVLTSSGVKEKTPVATKLEPKNVNLTIMIVEAD